MSDALKDILVYPQKKSKPCTKNAIPSHFTEKSHKKAEQEQEKARKKAERLAKKREAAKAKKSNTKRQQQKSRVI